VTRDEVERRYRAQKLREAERLIEAYMPLGRDRDSLLARLERAVRLLTTSDRRTCADCGEEFTYNPKRFRDREPPTWCLSCTPSNRVRERATRSLCLLTEEEARLLIAEHRIEELAGRFVEHLQAADALGRLPELVAGLTADERDCLVNILFQAVAGHGVH
jgi:hypothetical protein